jgi:hypothetical protein
MILPGLITDGAKFSSAYSMRLWQVLPRYVRERKKPGNIISDVSRFSKFGGGKGIRTPDLLHAMQTRYQLRHTPK